MLRRAPNERIRLKFWFDVLTPKQVNFFKPIVDELRRRKHDVLCTSRHYREVEELAALKGLELKKVGEHGGGSLYGKVKTSAERTWKLIDVVQEFQPDCAVSFSSPEASRVAFGLRIRNVGFNDAPHAEAVCRLSISLMDVLMCPWIIPYKEFTRYGIARKKILRYRALDAAVWIRRGRPTYAHKSLKLDPERKTIVFRLEESKAAYRAGIRSISSALLNSLIKNFRRCNVAVLCRYPDQLESVRKDFGNSATIIDRVIDGTSLLRLCDLFIGSGGTMNIEASLLGVPNMSYAMHDVLTYRFVFSRGASRKCTSAKEMVRLATSMLYDEKVRKTMRSRGRRLLSQMEDPKKKIIETLESGK